MACAVRERLVPDTPCVLPGAGTVRSAERPVLTPAQVADLAAVVPPRLSAAVLLAAWSGMRSGEQFALARKHVDLDAGTVRVERALSADAKNFTSPKTSGSVRTLRPPAEVINALAEHMDQHTAPGPGSLLFTTASGRPVTRTDTTRELAKARRVLDLPTGFHWHDLRHTGATFAYQVGASVPQVQRLLGHTTNRAAMLYAHASDESARAISERLSALVVLPGERPRLRGVGA
jgi:integrase